MRRRVVGEVVAEGKKRGVRDLFGPAKDPLPAGDLGAPHGSIVEASEAGGAWRVDKVLAPAGSGLESMYRIAARHRLDPLFPPAVEAEAAALVAEPGIDDARLEDLTALPFVTIDGPGTRDLDQALHLERAEGGGWVVRYALADASHCVRPGTALFAEALSRGASFYLPGLAIPMLPRSLSEGVVSLGPRVDRRAALFTMRVSPEGECLQTRLSRARIRSRAQLTFEGVQRFLDGGEPLPAAEAEASVRLLPEIGLARIHQAAQRNVVSYRRHEAEVKLAGGQEGEAQRMRFVFELAPRAEVERYNEQLSLLCNIEGARLLLAGKGERSQPIYRIHPMPDEARYRQLEELLAALARRHHLDPARWCWRRGGRPLAEFLAALPSDGPHARVAQAIHRQAVLTNARSSFALEPSLHHGVGAEVYARFSAPMREIVGVFLHKEAFEHIGAESAPSATVDEALRERIVDRANAAKSIQHQITKDSNRLVLDELFGADARVAEDRRPRRRGTLMGVSEGRVFVELDEPAVEVKVYRGHLERIHGGPVTTSADGAALLRGDDELFRVGDAVEVWVLGSERDRWALGMR
jgi:ribonuclease R